MPSYYIFFIRHTGPYGPGNLLTMEKLKDWALTNLLLNDETIILGIARDNPELTNPKDCRYDACLVVSKNFCFQDESINRDVLNRGKYAVFTIAHTADVIQQAWNDIFYELQKQGLAIDYTKPILERYITKMVQNHLCELCIPIQ